MVERVIVRKFDGSLAAAQGLLAVEQATFDECPYTADQVQAMLTAGPQRAWLAVTGERVIGFVVAFPTEGLRGMCWEIDLLAVHPDWRGRGLAGRLVRAAAAEGVHALCRAVTPRARAAVAVENDASARAFTRTGFQADLETCKLLIYRTGGLAAREWSPASIEIRPALGVADAAAWLPQPPVPGDHPGQTLLLAEQNGQPAGYAELVEVQTLLYHGVWIESLVAQARAVRETLIHEAVNWAIVAGLDEIGAMVPERRWPLQAALLARGFRSLGDFRWYTARLPLPGRAQPTSGSSAGGEDGSGRV